MKYRQDSQEACYFPQTTTPVMRNALLIWSIVLLTVGVGRAQTNPPEPAVAQFKPSAQPITLVASTRTTPLKSSRLIPVAKAVATPSLAFTNTTPAQAGLRLEVAPRADFLEGAPELSIQEPKANELTLGGYTYSGMVVQVIKATKRIDLLNPAAPVQYGSGWDNVEVFPGGVSGPALKLFSISF